MEDGHVWVDVFLDILVCSHRTPNVSVTAALSELKSGDSLDVTQGARGLTTCGVLARV